MHCKTRTVRWSLVNRRPSSTLEIFSVPVITLVTSWDGNRQKKYSFTGLQHFAPQDYILRRGSVGRTGPSDFGTKKKQPLKVRNYQSNWLHFTEAPNPVRRYRLRCAGCTRIQHLQWDQVVKGGSFLVCQKPPFEFTGSAEILSVAGDSTGLINDVTRGSSHLYTPGSLTSHHPWSTYLGCDTCHNFKAHVTQNMVRFLWALTSTTDCF